MRLSTFGLVAVVATLVIGIIPGLIALAELAAPGLQVVPPDDSGVYRFLVSLHGAAWSVPLALAAIALSLLQASESARLPILRIVGLLALVACPVVFAVATFAGTSKNWGLYHGIRDGMSIAAVVLLIANITLAVAHQASRLAVLIFSAFSMLAIGFAFLILVILNTAGGDSYLRDSYAALALDHAYGVSIILGAFAGVSGWITNSRGTRTVLASLVSGLVIAVVGYFALRITFTTGVMGMPRFYSDYPPQFAKLLGSMSLWLFALAAAVVAGFVWLLRNLRQMHTPGPETTFD